MLTMHCLTDDVERHPLHLREWNRAVFKLNFFQIQNNQLKSICIQDASQVTQFSSKQLTDTKMQIYLCQQYDPKGFNLMTVKKKN